MVVYSKWVFLFYNFCMKCNFSGFILVGIKILLVIGGNYKFLFVFGGGLV